MPADNTADGIPPREKVIGHLVRDVNIAGGAITLTFGNNAAKLPEGKRLTLRPAVVADQPKVPVAWNCNDVPVSTGKEVRGRNETDIAKNLLPVNCRGPSAGP
jgi:type IV pilus assembly protein PilA